MKQSNKISWLEIQNKLFDDLNANFRLPYYLANKTYIINTYATNHLAIEENIPTSKINSSSENKCYNLLSHGDKPCPNCGWKYEETGT